MTACSSCAWCWLGVYAAGRVMSGAEVERRQGSLERARGVLPARRGPGER